MTDVTEQVITDLVELAVQASRSAYCPYSHFRVGAAILTEAGTSFFGCNVENASYGLTICAERNAVGQMVAHGEGPINLLVIYTPTQKPLTPCGACREVIRENGPNTFVVCVCDGSESIRAKISELLPAPFGLFYAE